MLRAIDLCCGAGGWAVAARGLPGLPIQIELAVDWWRPAVETYRLNHPQTRVWQQDLTDRRVVADLRTVAKGVDVVLGAVPCGWLSEYRKLNKTKPEEIETGRRLLDTLLDLVAGLRPRWWVLEDVTQLRKELPIFTPWCVLDSRHWGPQRRKRIYVGRFPRPRRVDNREVMGDRLRPGPYRIGPRAAHRTPVVRNTFSRSETLAAYPDAKSPTVMRWSSRRDAEMVVVDPGIPGGKRQGEWQEAALLQGFPEDYVFWGSPSDVAAMVGDAVQIDTARAILEAIASVASADQHKHSSASISG